MWVDVTLTNRLVLREKIMITREQCNFFESALPQCCQTWEGKHWKPQCASNISSDSRSKIQTLPEYYLILLTKCFPELFPDF